MSFSFTPGIPTANQAISSSQSPIAVNFTSIGNILPVDHVGFNTAAAGQHQQVTFNNQSVTPSLPNNAIAQIYPIAGKAQTGNFDAYLYNASGLSFPLNLLRACGVFSTSSTTNSFSGNTINCASISTNASGSTFVFTITLSTGATSGTNVMPFFSSTRTISSSFSIAYGFTAPNILTITTTQTTGVLLSFMVLQI